MRKQLQIEKWGRCKSLFIAFLLTIFACQVQAQDLQVKGKVIGSDGGGIPGVSVSVKGTSKATSTDPNGNYSISAPSTGTLVFSYIGYASKEMPVAGKTSLNVTLSSDVKTLDQVVVVGYGTTKRKDLTGAVSSVSAEQIEKVPVTTLDQALQGRSAGVQITSNDGSPGAGIQVQIRGIGSLGNNDPLYVVDGYPISGGLNTLNPNDIATIDILKDASATAIYGNRAANGVVIITTKRGKIGQTIVSVDAIGSVQSQPKKYDVLNAQQFATLAASRAVPDGFGSSNNPEWANPSALQNINWQDIMYQTGARQNYNVGIRGGSEKLQSALSVGYLDQKGIVKGAYFKRVNASLNSDYTPFTWLKGSANLKYTRNDNKVPFGTGGQNGGLGIGSLTKLVPYLSGNPATNLARDDNGNYGYYPIAGQLINYLPNPLYVVETQDQKNLTNYFLGNVSLEATILPGLKIKTNYGINTNDFSGYYFTPSDTRGAPLRGSSPSFYKQNANNTFEYLWENTLSYTKTFGEHSIDFVGGVSQQDYTYRQISAGGTGSISDALRDLGSVTTITSIGGNQITTALKSQFARLNYKFMDKYLLTGTVRRDGSSKFFNGNQYGVFPSVSAAWRVKSEKFLQNVNAISDLKIRASYGQVGSQSGIRPFQYLAQYSPGGSEISANNVGYPFGGVYQPGLVLQDLPNPNLKWETSDQTDIGLDAAFLDGKLTLTADYYNKESRDFLLFIPVPSQTGYSNASRNVGSIRNSGLEFAVGYRESAGEFKYGVNFNITTVKNQLLSLAASQNSITNLASLGFPTVGGNTWDIFSKTRIGDPVGEFYGFKTDGIFQNQGEIDALNAKAGTGSFYQASTTVPGDRKFVDVNGDGKVTDDDKVGLGSPIPTLFSGLNLDASYKNFDVSLFFYGSFGGKIFNYAARTQETFRATQGGIGIENIGTEYFQNAWTPTNPSNRYARITQADLNGNTRPSDVYVESGNYVRLRNVQIGYTLPKLISSKFAVSSARIFVSGQNLFTITKYSGLDPEIGIPADPNTGSRNVTAAGVDVGTYPSSKMYTLGLNVTF